MLPIVPKPNGSVSVETGRYAIPQGIVANVGTFEPWCIEAFASRVGKEITAGTPWLTLCKAEFDNAEAYTLSVTNDGVVITAATENGVVQALTSLYLILDENGAAPICKIEDHPKYEYRGQHFDCSRHFFTVEVVKQILEMMSMVKLNVMHWHLTDDQGWRIESKKYPKLHEVSGNYYSQVDIKEIVEFARVRGIEVIPEIDVPGHTTAVLAAYPELSCSGQEMKLETGSGIFSIILCAGKEEVFTFFQDILDEVCPLFPSKRFHIGGDEAPKGEWNKCPHCAKRMADEGIANAEDLQGYFTNRVAAMLAKHSKSIICWNDSLEAGNLPDDVLIEYWTNMHAKPMPEYMAKGGKFVYARKFDLYFDYPYALIPVEKVYSFKPIIVDGISAEVDSLIGLEGCLWSERVPDLAKLGEQMFPRVYALAENCWSVEKDYADFKVRLEKILAVAEKNGVPYNAKENWDPSSEERMKNGMAGMKQQFADIPPEQKAQVAMMLQYRPEMLANYMKPFFSDEEWPKVLEDLINTLKQSL